MSARAQSIQVSSKSRVSETAHPSTEVVGETKQKPRRLPCLNLAHCDRKPRFEDRSGLGGRGSAWTETSASCDAMTSKRYQPAASDAFPPSNSPSLDA